MSDPICCADVTIDPSDVPRYGRPRASQQGFLMFSVLTAGKRASVQAKKLNRLLSEPVDGRHTTLKPSSSVVPTPFVWLRRLTLSGHLERRLRDLKLGKYALIVPCFKRLARGAVDALDTGVEELMELPGIGPKTARFYLTHTDRSFRGAVLDTHVLSWLNRQGYDAPDQTPSSESRYQALERQFLKEADTREMRPAELDALIWKRNSTSA